MADEDKFLNDENGVSNESSSDTAGGSADKPEDIPLSKDAVKKALDVAQSVGGRSDLRHFGAFGLGNLDDSISLYEYIDEAEKRSRSLFESTFSDEKRPVEDLDVLNIAAEFGRPDEVSEEGDDDFTDMPLAGAFFPEDTRDLKLPSVHGARSVPAAGERSPEELPLVGADKAVFEHAEPYADFEGIEIDGRKKKNGRLEDESLWKILFSSLNGKFTGVCALDTSEERRRFLINDGDVLSVSSSNPQNDLLSFLLREGYLSDEVVTSARREMSPPGGIHQIRDLLIKKSLMPLGKINRSERLYYESLVESSMQWCAGVWRLEPSTEISALPAAPIETSILSLIFRGCIAALAKDEACRVAPESSVLAPCLSVKHPLDELMLSAEESELVAAWDGKTSLGESLRGRGILETEDVCCFAAALVLLGFFDVEEPASHQATPFSKPDVHLPSLPVSAVEKKTDDSPDKETLKRQLALKVEKINNGTYFEILDIDPLDADADVASAKNRLSAFFDVHRFWEAGILGHDAEIDLVKKIVAEAFIVLGEPNRRECYRRAVQDGMSED